jgi:hypothetical protein
VNFFSKLNDIPGVSITWTETPNTLREKINTTGTIFESLWEIRIFLWRTKQSPPKLYH